MLMLTRSDVSRLVPARTFSRGGIDRERTAAIARAFHVLLAFVVRSSAFRLARAVRLAKRTTAAFEDRVLRGSA